MNYEDYRRNYVLGGLRSDMLTDTPFALFAQWQQQAIDAGLKDPTAVCLATLDTTGNLWQRIVLLKTVNQGGFVFFTNYESNKARALALDSRASMLFPWNELDRQVTVTGTVEKISEEESDEYFASRPRASQIGAWASTQSNPIASRGLLESNYHKVVERFDNADVPRPPHWGGYRLVASEVEFWQGGEHRLHDRFRYVVDGDRWQATRLQP